MYILKDGTEVSADQIKNAFANSNAVIIHGRADNRTSTSLMLDGKHFDTRDTCYSVWDEAWTCAPGNLHNALQAAYCKPASR